MPGARFGRVLMIAVAVIVILALVLGAVAIPLGT
jgi:hypothetical protein